MMMTDESRTKVRMQGQIRKASVMTRKKKIGLPVDGVWPQFSPASTSSPTPGLLARGFWTIRADSVRMVSETRRRHLIKQQIANAKPYDPLAMPQEPGLRDDEPPEWEGKFWFGEWLGQFAGDVLRSAFVSLRKSSFVQRIWRSWIVQYCWAVFINAFGVFFQVGHAMRHAVLREFKSPSDTQNIVLLQKLGMMDIGPVDFVGGPARGMTCIVTGPTSGIGTETASAMARRGAKGVSGICVEGIRVETKAAMAS